MLASFSAMSLAMLSLWASTMTRTRGSVPDARRRIRPVSPSSASYFATAAAIAEDESNFSFATSETFIKTCQGCYRRIEVGTCAELWDTQGHKLQSRL